MLQQQIGQKEKEKEKENSFGAIKLEKKKLCRKLGVGGSKSILILHHENLRNKQSNCAQGFNSKFLYNLNANKIVANIKEHV